jgi:uncharacterized protein
MTKSRRPVVQLLVMGLLVALMGVRLIAAFPKPAGYVNDAAGILDANTRAELDALARETEQATTAEIAIVTVQSLDGMTVEEYASRLFGEWGIGKKATDNGVLLLVAPNEREMRIEVGYGLEPILPDGLAGEIIRTELLPHFRDGNFSAGILQGARRIADIVMRNQPVSADERRRLEGSGSDEIPGWLAVPFFGLFVALGGFGAGVGLRTKTIFPLLWGGMFGGIPLMMSLAMLSSASAMILAPLGLGMLAWGYKKGESSTWANALRKGKSVSSDGWVMGTDSTSSGSGGSSSGSSGGSFGGGSSGGGGASGRW